MKQLSNYFRHWKVILAICLISIGIIEGGLQVARMILPLSPANTIADILLQNVAFIEPYDNKKQAKTLLIEENLRPKSFRPFLMWGSDEYRGEYINVDVHGVRKTWNPQTAREVNPDSIYMFGGSTMWGLGARDDYTIPSHLSKLLNAGDQHFTVFNYGENSYTFLMELVELMLLLRDGHRPGFVIFYDGANDANGAYRSGVAGNISKVKKLQDLLQNKTPGKLFLSGARGLLDNYCITCQGIKTLTATFNNRETKNDAIPQYTDDELSSLAEKTRDHYIRSLELLEQLSRVYGFKYMCFWQPTILSENRLVDGEVLAAAILNNDKGFVKFYRYLTNALAERPPSQFFDISNVLNKREKAAYIDWAHLSENGNYLVANSIAQIFNRHFNSKEELTLNE